jgi:NAD(P)-dependent dehydrogenase (short-subunit alcohol dehydrogenase family)
MSDKNFIVVGGSKGIGLGITKRLADRGHQVTVLSRTADSLGGLAGVSHQIFDVTTDELDKSSLPEMIAGVAYCPGSINLRSFRSLKPEVFREDFELNVIGAIKVLQASLAGLKRHGDSSVLLFSTVAVSQGMHAHASIAASKGAIEGLTRSLAAELSPHTRVNCLAPALTNTPLTEKFFADPEKAKSLAEKYPLGRTGTVDDLSATGVFLLDGESDWITGQVWGVDGGMARIRK